MITSATLVLAAFFASSVHEDRAAPPAFTCQVVLSDDITLEDRWEHTLGTSGVHMSPTRRVVRGQMFKTFVFFMNATPDAKDKVDVRTDVTITGPDGKTYHEQPDIPAYRRGGAGGNVQMVDQMLALSFDPPDALGEYRFSVVVRDVNGKTSAKGAETIELVESIEGEDFGDGEQAVEAAAAWSMSVQAATEPHRLIQALEAMAGAGILDDGPQGTPLRTFFREAFDAHPFLFVSLGKLAADTKTDASVRDAALLILATGRTDEAKRLNVVPEAVRKACAALKTPEIWDPRAGTIEEAGHLDQLWATFFATGSFQPIARITEVLDLDPKGSAEEVVMHGAARWSLDSIAEQNELAHAYLTWMAEHPKTPAARKEILKEILAD